MSVSMVSPLPASELITDGDLRRAVGTSIAAPVRATLTEARKSAWKGTYRRRQGEELVISVEGDAPPWAAPTLQRMGELLELAPDWDTYGAYPISPNHINTALDLLVAVMRDDTPAPTVVPTNRGGVQLEWHTRGIDLEVETLAPHRFLVAFEEAAANQEREWELTTNLTPLVDCLARVSQ